MGRNLVFIVRHAVAEDQHEGGDAARALTAEGRRAFRTHAGDVAAHARIEHVVTSPLVRAVQTAELLADACAVDDVQVARALAPGREAARRIAALARAVPTRTALVGHEPSLSQAVALLLGVDTLPFTLRKGAVLALARTREGPWSLVWRWNVGGRRKRGEA